MSTETLRPSAAGDECNIPLETGAACPNHYQNVDEVTHDSSTTQVYVDEETAGWQRDLYNLGDSGVGAGTINHITVYAVCEQSESPPDNDTHKIAISSGGTPAEGAAFEAATDWTLYNNQWAEDPDTSAAWTWAAIDALQAGISVQRPATRSAYASCTQIYVVVDYTAVITGIGAFYQRRNPFGLNIQTAGQVRAG